eukprot:CAMPEP_0201523822 /NCGR_PEP_ID=MMETSP0161_2-20130828/20949_1 /ASSEMBLY_ACC=CAM_ASM_000251 /TAXON_ID=180227 /ORGANISM="Neoparamoeba aestuarina, Strain SoJaBio B1-5/56/2" /LENGTH=221 /DNA_ID=CAMNT_0047923047 /DNA_START=37 /DNA_END=699 /DNA_ORIENTATION=-
MSQAKQESVQQEKKRKEREEGLEDLEQKKKKKKVQGKKSTEEKEKEKEDDKQSIMATQPSLVEVKKYIKQQKLPKGACLRDLTSGSSKIRSLTKSEKGSIKTDTRFEGKDYKYVTTTWLRMEIDNGQQLLIPKGFLMDGASGVGYDKWGVKGWVAHDWMYSYHYDAVGNKISKFQADRVLNYDAWWLSHRVLATWLFGKWAWKSSGKRGPEFLTATEKKAW